MPASAAVTKNLNCLEGMITCRAFKRALISDIPTAAGQNTVTVRIPGVCIGDAVFVSLHGTSTDPALFLQGGTVSGLGEVTLVFSTFTTLTDQTANVNILVLPTD